eukprot:CAMPEP_0185766436 /NCGR_PEP_ID=MMETSP1174-20130828/37081_1 /TAXON_ID=35687 /ORGANISM="Dictyocha speculum, Strain CCMP1381" /LENGTH=150 /DNA_ID=CAMNT_0028450127 /DNA_START=11 /DNA_END=463 /DNA_ORIENTATION=-
MAELAQNRAVIAPTQTWSTVIECPAEDVFALIRPLTFKWMNTVMSASEDESNGMISIAYADNTVQSIQLVGFNSINMQVQYELVSSDPPSHCASQVHTITCYRITDKNHCFVTWTTDFSSDVTPEVIADCQWKKNDSFEQLKSSSLLVER